MSLKIIHDEEDGIIVPNFRLDIYVHLEITHLFKIIGRWICFKIRSYRKIKKFYVRAIIFLIKSKTLN
jgi:hypothetical protein